MDVIIVGAGISGLLAATQLVQQGYTVHVLEKSRGVGGRMATRRIGNAVLDHGAQFFTVRSDSFQSFVDRWIEEQVAALWCRGFTPDEGHPRYRGSKAMTDIPKHLAQSLAISFQTFVDTISLEENRVEIQTTNSERFQARSLVLTPPLPQVLQLLERSQINLPIDQHQAWASIEYDPCLVVLCTLSEESRLPDVGAVQVQGEIIDFIADNHKKGISPQPALTIHASPAYSREHYEAPDEPIIQDLLAAAQEWLPGTPQEIQVKRWRYSKPVTTLPDSFGTISEHPPVLVAGDAFNGARVEGAACSGLACAEEVQKLLREFP